jgi:phosphohistidine phosphatase
MKNLLIMRHAKSSWEFTDLSDHDRPLNTRGKRDAPRLGKVLLKERLVPQLIISSSAETANTANNNTETIAYVNQLEDMAAKHGDWESSGILDVSKYFGKGTWLINAQAHTLKEGGQLLLLNISDS